MEFKPTVNPLLSPRGSYLFQAHLRWWWWGGEGLIEKGGILETGGLVLYKKIKIEINKLVYKVEKLKYKKVGRRLKVMQPRIKIKSELAFGK